MSAVPLLNRIELRKSIPSVTLSTSAYTFEMLPALKSNAAVSMTLFIFAFARRISSPNSDWSIRSARFRMLSLTPRSSRSYSRARPASSTWQTATPARTRSPSMTE
jgi:hypothetical protein